MKILASSSNFLSTNQLKLIIRRYSKENLNKMILLKFKRLLNDSKKEF